MAVVVAIAGRPRAAIVGAGLMGSWHAEAAARAGARVAVVVDRDVARARALAARFRGCEPVTDVAAAIAAADVVHICTPIDTHAALAASALEARRHVFLEKPVAPTADETARLLALADARGVLLCPAHQFIFQHGVQMALRRLPEIGSLRHIDFTICSAGAAHGTASPDVVAGEVLPHPLSLLSRLVRAELATLDWSVHQPLPGELRALATIGSASVSVTVSMGGRPTVNRGTITGTAGTIELDLFHGYAVIARGDVSRARKMAAPFVRAASLGAAAAINITGRALKRQPAYPGLWELVDAFYAAARTGGPSPISAAETLDVARGCERLLQLRAAAVSSLAAVPDSPPPSASRPAS
jgi:predicted dehydrogenase